MWGCKYNVVFHCFPSYLMSHVYLQWLKTNTRHFFGCNMFCLFTYIYVWWSWWRKWLNFGFSKLTTIFRPKNWAYWMSAVHFWQTLRECLKNISFKTDDVKMSIPWQLTLLKIVCLPVPYLRQADTSSCICNGGGCETAGCATTTGAGRPVCGGIDHLISLDHF